MFVQPSDTFIVQRNTWAPVWLSSRHVRRLVAQLSHKMRTITECIKYTSTYWLPTLSHVASPHLRRQETLAHQHHKIAPNIKLTIHEDIAEATFHRLRSRRLAVKTAEVSVRVVWCDSEIFTLHKWGKLPSAECDCGDLCHTVTHVLLDTAKIEPWSSFPLFQLGQPTGSRT